MSVERTTGGNAASIGVVVPAYDPDLERLSAYVRAIEERLEPETIRIEVDAPESGLVDQLNRLPATVNSASHRRGKGAAITHGFETLETDILAFADADGATPAPELASVVEPVATGRTDVAVGSRRHPDASVETHQTVVRRHMGDVFARLAHRLLDVSLSDYQCGAKAISASGWRRVRSHLHEPGFAWDIEFVAMADAHDLRITEVPIEWYDRAGSTVSPLRDSLDLARALLVVDHRRKRLTGSRIHGAIAKTLSETSAGPVSLVE